MSVTNLIHCSEPFVFEEPPESVSDFEKRIAAALTLEPAQDITEPKDTIIVHAMEQILATRGFAVKSSCTPDAPKLIKETAMLLSNQNDQLSWLMKNLRRAITASCNNTAYIDLKGTPEEIALVNAAVNKLHSLGYIESMYKDKANKNRTHFTVTANQKCTAFLNGGWMELWVYQSVQHLCKELGLECEVKTNVCLEKKGTGKLFSEHDLLLYVGGQLVWVESKSGEFISSLQKYHELGKILGVVPQYTVLVAAQLTDPDEAEALSYNFDYHVCPAAAFEQTMRNLLLAIKEQMTPDTAMLSAKEVA